MTFVSWPEIRHFEQAEFFCKCGYGYPACLKHGMQHDIVASLDSLRELWGKPIVVTSGYRCPIHNARVSTTGRNGPHTTGCAVDISCSSGSEKYGLLKLIFNMGVFTGVGIGHRFIHLDNLAQPDFPRPTIWGYPKT